MLSALGLSGTAMVVLWPLSLVVTAWLFFVLGCRWKAAMAYGRHSDSQQLSVDEIVEQIDQEQRPPAPMVRKRINPVPRRHGDASETETETEELPVVEGRSRSERMLSPDDPGTYRARWHGYFQ